MPSRKPWVRVRGYCLFPKRWQPSMLSSAAWIMLGSGQHAWNCTATKTNKKAVIEELKRTMQVRPLQTPRMESELAALDETRRRQNEYCQAVNLPIAKSEETPCSLYGRLLPLQSRLAESAPPLMQLPACVDWTEPEIQRKRTAVSTLQSRVERCGVPSENLFWGSRLRFFLPTHADRIQQALSRGVAAIRKLSRAGEECAVFLEISAPGSLDEAVAVGRYQRGPDWKSSTSGNRSSRAGMARAFERNPPDSRGGSAAARDPQHLGSGACRIGMAHRSRCSPPGS